MLERLREHTTSGLPFAAALEATAASTVFTTHTAVAAGHDVFPPDWVVKQFASYPAELGVTPEQLLQLGRAPERSDVFSMTRLALRLSAGVNGVSKIHGLVSSRLCASNWPDVPPAENPVGYVTNGVHVSTFLRHTWAKLFDHHLGAGWRDRMMDRASIARIEAIPDAQFWETSQKVKGQMFRVLRERLTRQCERNGLGEAHVQRLLKLLDPDKPDVLTIGFARRFAAYKRATLLMADLQWLEQIVCAEDRPVLFVFAGKAHPADEPAQWMMREIQRISSLPPFVGRILLVEGYDLSLGRLLTSGVDVWLNTPVHPLEASGTSGMKAAINGTVNLSVLDGWWAEAYDGRRGSKNGWGIPPARDEQGDVDRDRQDSTTLYEILQDELVPLYYARDEGLGYSPEWVQLCKRSMASVLPAFNSERVLRDYLQRLLCAGGSPRPCLGGRRLQGRSRAWVVEGEGASRMAWRVAEAARQRGDRDLVRGACDARGRGRAERLGAERRARRMPGAARARLGARHARPGLCRESPAEARRQLSRRTRGAAGAVHAR